MKVLLDTHTFLWFVLGDTRLIPSARGVIEEPKNEKWISPASFWELAIKIAVGKYDLNEDYAEFLQRGIGGNGFLILAIEPKHTAALLTLPFHHRDPFDRLLIAQALVEQVSIVSADLQFDTYGVSRL
jgi:PIN domain nuclease of toxin-antitoxin system